jgi:hypothetical protein
LSQRRCKIISASPDGAAFEQRRGRLAECTGVDELGKRSDPAFVV